MSCAAVSLNPVSSAVGNSLGVPPAKITISE